MITKNQIQYSEYLNGDYWQKVSEAVKARAGWRCQVCNSDNSLCAHHRTYEHRGCEMDHLSDLICLCKSCHDIFHHVEKHGRPEKKKEEIAPCENFVPAKTTDTRTQTRVLNQETIQTLKVNGGMTVATLKALGLDWSFTKKVGMD